MLLKESCVPWAVL